MKRLLLVLTLLSSSLSANDRVGEWIQHAVYSNQGHIAYLQNEYKTHHTRTDALIEEKLTADAQGNILKVENETVEMKDVFTPQLAMLVIQRCVQIGGVIEKLTIYNQSVQTCKLPIQANPYESFVPFEYRKSQGHIWMGPFPVNGMVKLETPQVSLELTGYHWNL